MSVMGAATSGCTPCAGLPWGRPLGQADVEAMPDDGHRYELVDAGGEEFAVGAPYAVRCVPRRLVQ